MRPLPRDPLREQARELIRSSQDLVSRIIQTLDAVEPILDAAKPEDKPELRSLPRRNESQPY